MKYLKFNQVSWGRLTRISRSLWQVESLQSELESTKSELKHVTAEFEQVTALSAPVA